MTSARYRLKAHGWLGWLFVTAFSLPALGQNVRDSLDGLSVRAVRDSLDSFSLGGGLSAQSLQSFESVSGFPLSGGTALAAEFLREGGTNRAALESMMQQYSGYLTADQIQQLESFAAPLIADPSQLDSAIAELGAALDGVDPSGAASTFEAAPVGEEANVEPLFLSGQNENTTLPRFGSAEGQLNTNLKPFLFVPYVFQDGSFNYDTADFTLRPFYLDFESIEVVTLYTDNALLSSENQEDDVVIATNLDFSMIVQIMDSFRLAAGASLVYLPLSNEIGFSSLGGAGLRGGLIGQVEAVYEIPVGRWDLTVFDRFSAQNYSFAGGRDSGFAVFSNEEAVSDGLLDRSLVDVDGHNVAVSQVGLQGLQNQRQERFESDGTEFRNQIGASMTRLLPGDNRLTFEAGHSDSWFTGFNAGIPRTTDSLGVSLASERENTRFKPSLSHNLFRTNIRPGWDRISTLTISGPVTDYIDLTGKVGFYVPSGIDAESVLWGVDIGHTPRPSIYYALYIEHGAAGPNVDLSRDLGARVSWTVGPWTGLDFVVEQREFLDLDGDDSGSQEYRIGAIVNQELGKGLTGTFGVIYRELNFSNLALGNNQIWTSRMRLQQQVSDTVSVGVTYQLEDWLSSIDGGSFVENLVILSVVKQL